ncbi:MAG: GtrA family protein [Clostridia bacterium]|nr:GtrA family protein [Clostridia bacterium]
MKTKIFDKSILRFLLVGVGNTLLSAVLMFLLEGLGYWISTAVAYIAGAVMSFFLNRYFTFKSEEKLMNSALKFALNVVLCYVIAYSLAQPLVSLVLSKTAVSLVWQERIAKVFGMGLYTVINYFGQRFFAFKRTTK